MLDTINSWDGSYFWDGVDCWSCLICDLNIQPGVRRSMGCFLVFTRYWRGAVDRTSGMFVISGNYLGLFWNLRHCGMLDLVSGVRPWWACSPILLGCICFYFRLFWVVELELAACQFECVLNFFVGSWDLLSLRDGLGHRLILWCNVFIWTSTTSRMI